MNVASWLRMIGLEQYEPKFRENKIDVDLLPSLTADDLKDLGVNLVGDRRRLLDAIASLRAEATPVGKAAATPSAAAAAPDSAAVSTATDPQRRQLTLLFCDLVGSTALSTQVDPEDLRELINAYHACCAKRIAQHGGYVAKYMGDGVLAYFGYPEAHEDDAVQAIHSALSILDGITTLPAKAGSAPQARIGIATGLVVVGDLVGKGSAQERNVVGDTPNLAARLQGLAPPGTVVIAESTHRLARGLFEYRDLGEAQLKGFAEPIRGWQVIGSSGVESRFDAFHPAGFSPLVGREEEIDLLVRRWTGARGGEGRMVLLTGEPGIGKSRIAAALHERIQGDKHIRLRYFCSPRYQDSALYPIIAQLERAAGFAREDGTAEKLRKLQAVLTTTSPQCAEFALLAELLSLSDHDSMAVVRDMAPWRKRQKTLEALLLQLDALASRQPVLIVFEDVHWIDPTSLELLGLMVERVQQLPVLLLVTARPEFNPPWPNHAHVTTLPLTRLSRQEGAALAQHITGGKALPREVMHQILARTDGVPLFVEELTKMVMESSLLQEREGHYVHDGPLPTLAIPATLHDSLMARLDRLSPVRDVAQIGAVIGREFSYELLSAVAELSGPECDEALGRLVQSELVFRRGTPPQAMFMFKHALVRDAAYRSLLRGRRQVLHARVADALESRFPEVAAATPEVVAHHLTEAGRGERAVAYWLKAGQRAAETSALAEAAAHLARGLEALVLLPEGDGRDRAELELQTALGTHLMPLRGWAAPEVERAWTRSLELCKRVGDEKRLPKVLWGQSVVQHLRSELGKALATAESLLRGGEERHDLWATATGHRSLGHILTHLARFGLARSHLERLAELEAKAGSIVFAGHVYNPFITGRTYLARCLLHSGHPDQAGETLAQVLGAAECSGHLPTLAFVIFQAAELGFERRDPRATRAALDRLVPLSREQGYLLWLAMADALSGWVEVENGEGEAACAGVRRGLEKWEALGTRLMRPYLFAVQASTQARADRIDEALASVDAGLTAVADDGEVIWGPELHRLRGELLLVRSRSDAAEAEVSYARSLAIARGQDAKLAELRAATSLARFWAGQGERRRAADLLAPIYAWFTEGFGTPDLGEARTLLNELR
jgi:class 3 adenylate cyclase/predicted ATPase